MVANNCPFCGRLMLVLGAEKNCVTLKEPEVLNPIPVGNVRHDG